MKRIGVPAAAAHTYFHQMLMTLGGWAQYARYRLWQAELAGRTDPTTSDFLAIRLIWEAALFDRYEKEIGARWASVVAKHALPVTPNVNHVIDAILQEASERAAQRKLAEAFAMPGTETIKGRPRIAGRLLYRCALGGISGVRSNPSTRRSRPWGSRAFSA